MQALAPDSPSRAAGDNEGLLHRARVSINGLFTDETAACMLVGEHAFVMLLTREKFAEFSKLPIADPATRALAPYCFSVPSRDEVDAVSAAALATGATEADGAQDYGFTYSRSFFDLDGHGWQVTWMDREAAAQGPEAFRGLHAGRRGLTHHDAPPIREGAPLAREPGTVILAA